MAEEVNLSLALGAAWEIPFTVAGALLAAEFRLGDRSGQLLAVTKAGGGIAADPDVDDGYLATVGRAAQADLVGKVYSYEIWVQVGDDVTLHQSGSLDAYDTFRNGLGDGDVVDVPPGSLDFSNPANSYFLGVL